MNTEDLYLERWDTLSVSECHSIAQEVSRRLPNIFQFTGIQEYRMGDQQHRVALFDHDGAAFALLPGHTATLGYDPDRPLQFTQEQWEDWNETAAEYQIEVPLQQSLLEATTPLRTVSLAPVLVEVSAWEVGLERIESNDEKKPGIYRGTANRLAYRENWHTHAQVTELLAAQGFRLLTSDEWEYACGAGSPALFRWGDTCPADGTPIDRECENFTHRQPNAFGLNIAQNPYDWECVAESDRMRGGDGGSVICGGTSYLMAWLTLASSYVDPASGEYEGEEIPGAFVRRALTIR